MYRERGLTLLELLVVVVIISMLAGLVLATARSARHRAYRTTCISNLRQLSAAAVMYRTDYGELPEAQALLFPYVKDARLFVCPSDPYAELGGSSFYGRFFASRHGSEVKAFSYPYIREHVEARHYRLLQSVDPNHGVFICALHDKCDWSGVSLEEAQAGFVEATVECIDGVLRARLDGSVEWKRVPMRWYQCPNENGVWTGARDGWRLMSDEPCPPEVCDRRC